MSGRYTLPDSILARHFDRVRAKWPGALLAAHHRGLATLSVPNARLPNHKRFNRDNVALLAVIPWGYPQAVPDDFFFEAGLTFAHGGLLAHTEEKALPGWTRIRFRITGWNSNTCDLLTVINTMRQMIGSAS